MSTLPVPAPGPGEVPRLATYPFAALVGQKALRLGLLLNAVTPDLGGLLIMGERGTGKSTAVRALADLLPEQEMVADCRFRCDPGRPDQWCTECRERFPAAGGTPSVRAAVPVVDLPLGATFDRLLGSLDLERALLEGTRAFEPGLLAKAHRGFLYIDEVNLLGDDLVDALLDVAASGVHVFEREGISLRHPARFVLVGSGNPEEGWLRPQFLDRFALSVQVTTPERPEDRVEIVRRRLEFERDPAAFAAAWEPRQRELRRRISTARTLFPHVETPLRVIEAFVHAAIAAGIEGHRAELAGTRAAAALAALEGRRRVTPDDVRAVLPLALAHRLPPEADEAQAVEEAQHTAESVLSDE